MNLNKFYYFLVVLLCSISFTACSDDDDKQTVPHIELTASMSAFSEGLPTKCGVWLRAAKTASLYL